ncbi:acyltransferase domain-containing protein [Methylomonas paludis]|uniref:Acyltransferase domain-containing protein n=1 Tax=Methylomonas paludis TaxID=1173101 RepID=A0A975MPG6_9GAMM|nr:acyltransferase domain-containing protein [Methylomonas paludis]QWF71623.1 acyltransferase domain-containing protein [Methylomonas paludis]
MESYLPPTEPQLDYDAPANQVWPVLVSANDEGALTSAERDLAEYLTSHPQVNLYDAAYHSLLGQTWHPHRTVVFGASTAEVAKTLLACADGTADRTLVDTGLALKAPNGAAFIYSGNGSQWAGMAKNLLAEDPVFKRTIRQVDAIYANYTDHCLETELAGIGADRYAATEIAQPALFAIQVGITQMLRSKGLMPTAVAGHSVGEVPAAWAAGALSLEAAVEIIYQRSRWQSVTKGSGAMTAVRLDHPEVISLLEASGLVSAIVIAGFNSHRGVTLSGDTAALAKFETFLTGQNIVHRRLALDYAFHSAAMDPIEAGVTSSLANLQPVNGPIPFYSTVTGAKLETTELGAEYWWHNIRKPVMFKQAINQMLADGLNIFIEIGPHSVLRSYINDSLHHAGHEGRIISTLNLGDDYPHKVWGAYRQAMIAGAELDWPTLFPEPGCF